MRMELVPYIDMTGANALKTFVRQARNAGAEVVLCGLKRQPLEFLARVAPPYAGAGRASTWRGALAKVER
ncbi:MAG: sodium-independent anion transporter [Sphingomicrobium sp.]